MTDLTHEDVRRFRSILSERLGIGAGVERDDALAGVLAERIQIVRAPGAGAYLESLRSGTSELDAIADALVVGETYFFRNPDQFEALGDVVVPARQAARGGSFLRILSAGCATGEEPYSIAVTLLARGVRPDSCLITGVDVSRALLARACSGQFADWALRQTPGHYRARFFARSGAQNVLDPAVRALVGFQPGNLVDPYDPLWKPGTYDVIFCRNVLMYFELHVQQATVARLAAALAPGGFLFLGEAETLRGLTDEFVLHHGHGTFYYERRAPRASAASDGIHRSATRVETITQTPAICASAPVSDRATMPDARWATALHLLDEDRFDDALRCLDGTARQDGGGLESRLLRAADLANAGRIEDAEDACRALLALDSLNAGARYVMALCREHAGDLSGAAEHDLAAASLDRTFAMPRLHLGLMARRTGDLATACRELTLARRLLAREDAPRILLFGGGFTRESLIRLTDAELLACGKGK